MKKEFLECGRIMSPHGVAGAMKIQPLCDSSAVLAGFKQLYIARDQSAAPDFIGYTVVRSSDMGRCALIQLEGITSPDEAAALRGKIVYARRGDFALNEGDYFVADLIGLPVIDHETGVQYGRLTGVVNRGGSDIYLIKTSEGERMIPAVSEFIKRTDLKTGIFVKLIPGILD